MEIGGEGGITMSQIDARSAAAADNGAAGSARNKGDARQMAPMQEVAARLERVLRAEGVPADDARITAAHMVEGTARGYVYHGVERIFQLLDGFDHGTQRPAAQRRTVKDGPGFAVLECEGGLGPPTAEAAMQIAIRKADEVGIATVGVLNAGHLGILAPWAEMAARAGKLGVALTASEPGVVIPGGRTAILGTNPIAYSFPVDGVVLSADFSTAATTRSVLLDHRDRGEPLPPGVAVDEEGKPTQDPEAALRGGLLPLGHGLKAAFFSVLISVIAGPLVGGVANHHVTGTRWMTSPPRKADTFIAIDIAQLTDVATFTDEVRGLLERIEDDVPGFYVPGTGAQRRRERAEREGIPVSARLADLLGLNRSDR
jgi:L-2-hydroxycarboxylate dehydrogenase (NAD+)